MHPAVNDTFQMLDHTFVSEFLDGQSRRQNLIDYKILREKNMTSSQNKGL